VTPPLGEKTCKNVRQRTSPFSQKLQGVWEKKTIISQMARTQLAAQGSSRYREKKTGQQIGDAVTAGKKIGVIRTFEASVGVCRRPKLLNGDHNSKKRGGALACLRVKKLTLAQCLDPASRVEEKGDLSSRYGW